MSLNNKVDQFIKDSDIAHRIVHGPRGEHVETEGGIVPSLATAVGDMEGLREKVEAIEAGQAEGSLTESTWARLISTEPALSAGIGTRAMVPVATDAGSHVDPIKPGGQVVPNSGVFVRRTAAANGWEWLTQDAVVNKADKAEVIQAKAEAVRDVLATRVPFSGVSMQLGLTRDWRAYAVKERTGELLVGLNTRTGEFYANLSPRNPSLRHAVNYQVGQALSGTMAKGVDPDVRAWAVNQNREVLFGINLKTGVLVGNFPGGGSTPSPEPDPMVAHPTYTAYLDAGALRAVGGAHRDFLLNGDANKTWLSAQVVGKTVHGVFEETGHGRQAAVVAIPSGRRYLNGKVQILTSDGQSNGEGQAGTSRAVVYGEDFGYGSRIRMPATESHNLWVGMATAGGASRALQPAEVFGLEEALSKIAPSNTHGTLPMEGMVRRLVSRADADCNGWIPELLTWTNAEGGQNIDRMMPVAPNGYYYFANLRTVLTRVQALLLAEGKSACYTWALMDQGEANTTDARLGEKHDTLRAHMQALAAEVLGQHEPLRMLTSQMSSFYTDFAGPCSILDHALASASDHGSYLCLGPTYIYPFSSDTLHYTSRGQAMRGEFADAAIEEFERTGRWLPLHMTAATVTGEREITVQLSEAAKVDTAYLVDPIENHGITLLGGAVESVAANGSSLLITTQGSASAITAVHAALVGHGATRQRATVPRSTIRSVASVGTWSAACGGQTMHKPLCHQAIPVT